MARVSQRKHEELGIKQTVYGVGQNWGGRLAHPRKPAKSLADGIGLAVVLADGM